MAIPSRQIGWGTESNLLWQILKQLNKLTSIMFGLKPKYKVYTALLTQGGGDDPLYIDTGTITIGTTYQINDFSEGFDFTNVGAPNNDLGTYFVATGTTPNSWGSLEGTSTPILIYNTGAPVATVLENTIGNIWFTYGNIGTYGIGSEGLFPTIDKWFVLIPSLMPPSLSNVFIGQEVTYQNENEIGLRTFGIEVGSITLSDNGLYNTPIEIRVYN